MVELSNMLIPLLLLVLTFVFLFTKTSKKSTKTKINTHEKLPKPYPIIGHLLAFSGLTAMEVYDWISNNIRMSPTSTVVVHNPFGTQTVFTGNPATVERILKTKYENYGKGPHHKTVFEDLFGDSLFVQDASTYKFQRNLISQEFTHKALQKFVTNVVNFEISERLIPTLADAAKKNKVIDLQDMLQRFTFDNICTIGFGHDPGYVSPSMPEATVSNAFETAMSLCHHRYYSIFPITWKARRFLNIGSEKKLKDSIRTIHEFASSMIKIAKKNRHKEDQEDTFLARLVKDDQFSDKFITDGIVSFILAGRDTSSSAMTWFFWLQHKNSHVEKEILRELENQKTKKQETSSPMEVLKGMSYTHAALSEAMRLYPPVPVEIKLAASDDVLPDGTKVKKGMTVGYFTQAMGCSDKIWGPDWPEFKPERWLKEDQDNQRIFVPRDAYTYPVFLGGPRICLGKEMSFLQMKSLIAAVLPRFKVVPVMGDGFQPVYVPETTATMQRGFPVRIVERVQVEPSKLN